MTLLPKNQAPLQFTKQLRQLGLTNDLPNMIQDRQNKMMQGDKPPIDHLTGCKIMGRPPIQ
ncbi:MAG: hypothetical protein EBY22_09270 [Gammaproteobacteria bacterium]|nr:hypothetical protein [Gammaproteobacteria bacterium]